MQLSLYGLGFATFLIFVSYTSGNIISQVFKFRSKNSFSNIALGFFSYFATLTILSFPLQLFGNLPYIFFIYYTIVLSQVYLLVCLLLFRYWITSSVFSIGSIVFFTVVLILMGVNFIIQIYLRPGNFAEYKTSLTILEWLKDNPVSLFNSNNTLFNFLGFKPIQSWYTFQLSMILLTGSQPFEYDSLILTFNFFLESFILASILITVAIRFNEVQHQGYRQIGLVSTILLFIMLKFFLGFIDFAIWNELTYFIYLIFYAITLLISYSSPKFREANLPMVIGFLLAGYISFSWENSYPMIFLLYCIVFTLQSTLSKNYTKDIIKIIMFPLINLIFFNVLQRLYVQAVIFSVIILIFFLVIYFMTKNYSKIIKFETAFDNHNKFFMLFLPVVFSAISLILILSSNQNLKDMFINYLSFIYKWTILVELPAAREWIALISTILLIVLSLVWIFIRKRFEPSQTTAIIDLTTISFITFYNPLVIRFISVIYSDFINLNGFIMAVLFVELITVALYSLTNRFGKYLENRTIKNRPKVRYKPNFIEIN
ncbi:hypothetical protein SSABA_v1c01060 [Spiroplasma sabaudiense Ar-1343]|uniref:Transmembrane protein n=1 Tax=Spiroplasma sabaudiense Ar-1343 TaxID=1276257 RepID=W6A8M3_9MOLU|nr:hypothetical protein [Spiroplasma sabaudiense]AHI53518.1 hypothetical protein SSABA_v1c01060 [Spiroplasma sabaudiense Ar-1343]